MTITLYARHGATRTHRDCGQQAFGDVGNNDANEEDDGLQPSVAEDEGEDEEGHAQEDGHARDQVDEVLDLLGNRGLSGFKAGGQGGDPPHDRAVTRADHDATCRAWQESETPS